MRFFPSGKGDRRGSGHENRAETPNREPLHLALPARRLPRSSFSRRINSAHIPDLGAWGRLLSRFENPVIHPSVWTLQPLLTKGGKIIPCANYPETAELLIKPKIESEPFVSGAAIKEAKQYVIARVEILRQAPPPKEVKAEIRVTAPHPPCRTLSVIDHFVPGGAKNRSTRPHRCRLHRLRAAVHRAI